MKIKKEQLAIILNNTSTDERRAVAEKAGYKYSTIRTILYGFTTITFRSTPMLRALSLLAEKNLKKSLKEVEKLNNKLK